MNCFAYYQITYDYRRTNLAQLRPEKKKKDPHDLNFGCFLLNCPKFKLWVALQAQKVNLKINRSIGSLLS